jgi:AAA family ATP:ADP antiporter
MQRLLFIIVCTLLVIKPTANAIFLSTLGVKNLPYAYLGVALMAFFITTIYNYSIDRFSSKQLFRRSLIISGICLIAIGVFLLFSWSKVFVAIIFYLFISLFGILSASQFWILANQKFDAREARKYFGFIGSGAIAGAITGGYIASIISTFTQSEYIPFFAALMCFAAVFVADPLEIKTSENELNKGFNWHDVLNFKESINKPLGLIKKLDHLKLLALLIMISVLVAKLIDYQFGYFASLYYTEEEELTTFYGFWMSTFNIISLVIQLFLTSKIVGRVGVGFSLIILPIILLVNISFLIFLPILVFAIGLKLADGSMKQSINKAAMELTMLPIPEDIKLRTKTFLDVFIDSIATGASGLILIFVVNGLSLPNKIVSITILLGTCGWLYIANKIRREYKKVFRMSLKIQSEKNTESGKSISDYYIDVLENGSEFQRLKALLQLKKVNLSGLEDVFVKLMHESNPNIVIAALETIVYKDIDIVEDVIPLLASDNLSIKVSAFEYLINHQNALEPNFILNHLNDKDQRIKMAALVACAKEFRNDPKVLSILGIEDRIRKIIDDYTLNQGQMPSYILSGAIRAIGYGRFANLYYIIDNHLPNKNTQIQASAILAAGAINSAVYFKKLLSMLENNQNPILVKTLSGFGVKKLLIVINKARENNDIHRLSLLIPILELIPDQEAVAILTSLATYKERSIKQIAIHSLSILKDKNPLLRVNEKQLHDLLLSEASENNAILSILLHEKSESGKSLESIELHDKKEKLINVLKENIDKNLKQIFDLLHISYPPEDYLELYDYVTGADTELRNNAIEYLESTLGPRLKSLLIPLIEYNILHAENIKIKSPFKSSKEVQEFLINHRNEEIRKASAAIYIFK